MPQPIGVKIALPPYPPVIPPNIPPQKTWTFKTVIGRCRGSHHTVIGHQRASGPSSSIPSDLPAVSHRITLPAPLTCRLYPRSGPSSSIPSDLPAVSRRITLPAPLTCRLYPRSGPSSSISDLPAVSRRITLPAPLNCRLYPRSGPSSSIPSELPAVSRVCYAAEACVTSLIAVSQRITSPAALARPVPVPPALQNMSSYSY
ncbi:hypothetical protein B0H14DRAFT_3526289 [Mycena olivaceomarginata]|nr:hypothetical protein B0H14DRAFT_3526289 [Mycena olivaceomarginata]